jgi:hypothetical protein
MVFYFEITKYIQLLIRKFRINIFCASFQFYFLCAFLVSENLVSKYEKFLILMAVATSTLAKCIILKPK